MKNRIGEDSRYLLGGALLGAAAMYLLDPEAGDRRRRRIAKAAAGTYGSARDVVGHELKHVSDRAKDLTKRLVARAHDVQGDAADYAQGLADEARGIANDLTHRATSYAKNKQSAAEDYRQQASGFGSHLLGRAQDVYSAAQQKLHDYAGSAADAAQGYMSQAQHARDDIAHRASHWSDWITGRAQKTAAKTRSMLGYEEPSHHYAGWASGAVGTLAVGAGLMYFFDPDRGGARRARVGGMVADCVQNTGKTMRDLGSRLSDSFYGVTEQARSLADRAMHGEFGGQQLINRAREAIAHITTAVNDIQFLADRDGTLTVTGNIAREGLEQLLKILHGVPGVSHVINRLEIRESAQHDENSPQSFPQGNKAPQRAEVH